MPAFIACVCLTMGPSQNEGAGNHFFQLRASPGCCQRAACQQGAEKRLQHEAVAQRLEYHVQVESRSTVATIRFAKQRPDHAHVGELLPFFPTETFAGIGNAFAGGKVVFVGDETVQRFSQHATVICQCKVHDHNPNIILATILRCISFEPPKIDNFRLLK